MKNCILILLLGFLIYSCDSSSEENNDAKANESDSHQTENNEEVENGEMEEAHLSLKESANEVLKALASYSFDDLIPFTTEKKEIIFSPYLTFTKEDAACLSPQALKENKANNAVLYWGIQDGTGDEINMTVENYFKRYVNRGDYLSKEAEIIENGIKIEGNSINVISDIFPNAEYISYYLPHDENDAAEMSWKTIVLVFERVNNELKLNAVVNHEWTI